MNREDATWLACAIECEGSIGIIKVEGRFYPRIQFVNTDVEIIRKFTSLSKSKAHLRSPKEGGQYLQVVINGLNALNILFEILPYMVGVKKDKAIAILRQHGPGKYVGRITNPTISTGDRDHHVIGSESSELASELATYC